MGHLSDEENLDEVELKSDQSSLPIATIMSPIIAECASIEVFNGTIVVPKQGVRCSVRIRTNVKTASMAQNDINGHLIQKS